MVTAEISSNLVPRSICPLEAQKHTMLLLDSLPLRQLPLLHPSSLHQVAPLFLCFSEYGVQTGKTLSLSFNQMHN